MRRTGNRDLEVARGYHAATKHSYASVRSSRHRLDWNTKPLLFKIYPDLPAIPLPREFQPPDVPALEALSSWGAGGATPLDLVKLTQVLFFSAGLTKKMTLPKGGEYHFRAAACAGALYPVEIYLVAGDLPGLPAGVYHFNPGDFTLRRLRDGDYRGALTEAVGGDPSVATSPVTLVLTAIYWRSAWKYQARAYRYCFWDAGTILANLLATASAAGLPHQIRVAFIDTSTNHLLGIDGEREGSLCLVPLGELGPPPPGSDRIVPIDQKTVPLSREELDYPEIHRMHQGSFLTTAEEVTGWAEPSPPRESPPRGPTHPFHPIGDDAAPILSLGEVILRRGSTRRFTHQAISFPQLSTIIDRSTRGIPADFLGGPGSSLLDIYLIANAVEGLPSGAYALDPSWKGLDLLIPGDFRRHAGYLCLEQELGADASAVLFFMADLNQVLDRYGNRGYRAAHLEAGIRGGKMYLAAYALGLGATGLTFYDDDVTEFFSPHAAGKSAIFILAMGRGAGFRSKLG